MYGLTVFNEGGNKHVSIDDNYAGMLNFRKTVSFRPSFRGGKDYYFDCGLVAGSDLVAVPVSTICHGYTMSSNIPDFYMVNGISRTGTGITVHMDVQPYSTQSGVNDDVVINVYERIKIPTNTIRYGLAVTGDLAYHEISDSTSLGYLTYSGVITVNGSYNLNSLASGGGCVFAYWNNAGAIVDMDNGYIVRVKGAASLQMYVCIFKPIPNLVKPAYGLAVWSGSGKMVYSSNYIPFSASKFMNINNGMTNSGITRPMVPLGRSAVGGQRNGNYYTIWFMGTVISGSNVGRGNGTNWNNNMFTGGSTIKFTNPTLSAPVLDAGDYFSF